MISRFLAAQGQSLHSLTSRRILINFGPLSIFNNLWELHPRGTYVHEHQSSGENNCYLSDTQAE